MDYKVREEREILVEQVVVWYTHITHNFMVHTKDVSDSVSIALISSSFKHTNQVVVGGIGTKLLFPGFQCCSPSEQERIVIVPLVS